VFDLVVVFTSEAKLLAASAIRYKTTKTWLVVFKANLPYWPFLTAQEILKFLTTLQ